MLGSLNITKPPWVSNECQSAAYEQPISWPSAMYFSDLDETWTVYEKADGAVARDAYIRVYDHATQQYRDEVKVGDNPLTNDEHGCPVLVRDSNERIMVFWGAHDNGVMKVSRTTNPNDETTWTALPDISIDLTYPKPILIGTTIYVFYRKDTERHLAGIWSETTTGNPSWTANKNIISVQDAGAAGFERCYQTQVRADGTDVYIIFNETEDDVSEIRDFYFCVFDTTDNSVRNLLDTQSWASGSQPVSRTDCDTYLRVHEYAVAGERGTFAQWEWDNDDNIHALFLKGSETTPSYDYFHTVWDGSTWSTPVSVMSIGPFPNTCSAIFNDGGTIKALMGEDDSARFAKGASKLWLSEYDGSSWSTPVLALEANEWGYSKIAAVKDSHPKGRVSISQVTSAETVEAGTIKALVWSPQTGFLKDA